MTAINRKHVAAWASYDFANSVYPAVIQTAVFSAYFTGTVVGNEAGAGDFWWGRATSTSALIIALSSPLLGAIADMAGIRKRMMALYTVICVSAVAMFVTLDPGEILYGFVLIVVANAGFEGALVFYNAYLPEIAPPGKQGRVSGLGFGVGYAGSIVGLLVALAIMGQPPDTSRLDLVWLAVAALFLGLSIPAFVILPESRGNQSVATAARIGLTQFRRILGEVLRDRQLRRFLLAFFFYIDGVVTVILFAGPVAETTFGFNPSERIMLFIVVQVSALVGAFALARPTDEWGPKRVISLTLVLWIAIVIVASLITSKAAFFAIAVVAGIGLGAVQAASRSFMAALIPSGREAEMFGFYAFCGKSSSIIGPFVFGTISGFTGGDQQLSMLALVGFFGLGLVLLQRVRDPVAEGAR